VREAQHVGLLPGLQVGALVEPWLRLPAPVSCGADSGQGDGSDERDDGFLEQHCKEPDMKAVVACLVGSN
jgi:hypothetical protein